MSPSPLATIPGITSIALLSLTENINQKPIGLIDSCPGRRSIRQYVEHHEVVERVVEPDGRGMGSRLNQLSRVGFSFVPQHVVFIRDHEGLWLSTKGVDRWERSTSGPR